MMKAIGLVCVFTLVALALYAGFEVGVPVKVDSSRAYSYDYSYQKALNETKILFRRVAVERELGKAGGLAALVKSWHHAPGASYNAAVAESLFMISSAAGFVISEEVLKDTQQAVKGKNYRLKMEYQARVLPAAKAIPSTLQAQISLSPARPKPGEQLTLGVTSAQDGWLFIFEFHPSGRFRLVYPGDEGKNRIKKGAAFTQTLTASQTKGYQSFLIIVTKDEYPGWRSFIKYSEPPDHWLDYDSGYGLFKGWLPSYDANGCMERFIQVEIR